MKPLFIPRIRAKLHPPCPPGKHCPECESNRKWQRIYAQKFEDPTYYLEGAMSHDRSAIHDL